MCWSRVVKERFDVISAIPNDFFLRFEFEDQSWRILRDLYQKNLIDIFSRFWWIGIALGYLSYWYVANEILFWLYEDYIFYKDI